MTSTLSGQLGLNWRVPLYREYGFYLSACKNWREVIRARRKSTPISRYDLRCGAAIEFSSSPPWEVFKDIWYFQIYTRAFGKSFRPKIIVDIGANIGVFSLFAAYHYPKAKVWSFEPEQHNYNQLCRNIQIDRKIVSDIHPIRAAVSNQSGSIRFYVKEQSGWHSIYSDSEENVHAIVEVPSVTIEDIITLTDQLPIDLLKIDCEGGEFDIIQSHSKLLGRHVRHIAMEYHEVGGHTVDQLVDGLAAYGFEVKVQPHKNWHTGMLYAWNRQKV